MPVKLERYEAGLRLALAWYDAFNRGDAAALAAPFAPQGRLEAGGAGVIEGRTAVQAHWAAFFAAAPGAQLAVQEIFSAGQRVIARWRLDGLPGGARRGADIFRISGGAIAELHRYYMDPDPDSAPGAKGG